MEEYIFNYLYSDKFQPNMDKLVFNNYLLMHRDKLPMLYMSYKVDIVSKTLDDFGNFLTGLIQFHDYPDTPQLNQVFYDRGVYKPEFLMGNTLKPHWKEYSINLPKLCNLTPKYVNPYDKEEFIKKCNVPSQNSIFARFYDRPMSLARETGYEQTPRSHTPRLKVAMNKVRPKLYEFVENDPAMQIMLDNKKSIPNDTFVRIIRLTPTLADYQLLQNILSIDDLKLVQDYVRRPRTIADQSANDYFNVETR